MFTSPILSASEAHRCGEQASRSCAFHDPTARAATLFRTPPSRGPSDTTRWGTSKLKSTAPPAPCRARALSLSRAVFPTQCSAPAPRSPQNRAQPRRWHNAPPPAAPFPTLHCRRFPHTTAPDLHSCHASNEPGSPPHPRPLSHPSPLRHSYLPHNAPRHHPQARDANRRRRRVGAGHERGRRFAVHWKRFAVHLLSLPVPPLSPQGVTKIECGPQRDGILHVGYSSQARPLFSSACVSADITRHATCGSPASPGTRTQTGWERHRR